MNDSSNNGFIDQMYAAARFFNGMSNRYCAHRIAYADKKQCSMEMFSEFCEHARNTYQAFYNLDEKSKLLSALHPFQALVALQQVSEFFDNKITYFAWAIIHAIEDIDSDWAEPNKIVDRHRHVVLYDFDADTPEMVYSRLSRQWSLLTNILELQVEATRMSVEICSRKELEHARFLNNAAVISFCNPPNTYAGKDGYAPLDFTGKAERVFQIALDDFQTEIPESAELAKFIVGAHSDRLGIICQCESGQSRSAGCAAAILEHYYHAGQSIFDDDRYQPDEMVYYSVLNALELCEGR